jgi:hypothetical protein
VAGLVRRGSEAPGAALRYLDTRALTDQLDRGVAALRKMAATEPEAAGSASRQHIAILERLRPALSPEAPAVVPRDARKTVGQPAHVRIGLAQICHELEPSEAGNSAIEAAVDEERGVASGSAIGASRAATPTRATPARDERLWRIENRSETGLRIVAPSAIALGLALGMLIAVREPRDDAWALGIVRRLARPTLERIEAGVAIIAARILGVALHAKRQPRDDMGFIVDGVDVSTIGERFDGIYLPPAARPDHPLATKTMIVPTSEYGDGQQIIVITARAVYTVALREALERHPEWTWAAIEIVERASRA